MVMADAVVGLVWTDGRYGCSGVLVEVRAVV
jgi:hypothetical protein